MNAVTITKQRGASIIEFGLVAFIFFLIMWGIFDFARAFYVRNSTQHLTRCIAREAVVRRPSQYDAAKASCLMQMGGSGSDYYWPFYNLTPTDMKPYFRIRYLLKNGGCVEEPANNNYDDQLGACFAGSAGCISYVQVYATIPGRPLSCDPVVPLPSGDEYGLLRTWLGIGGSAIEPLSSTTMPAESMGYSP